MHLLVKKISIYFEMGQSVVIVQNTQYDLDEVIYSVISKNNDLYAFIKIDMQSLINHRTLSESIVKQVNNFLDDQDQLEDFYDKEDDYHFLSYALKMPELIAKNINKKIVFIINDLEAAYKLDTDIKTMDIMRSIFQHQNNVIHMFTSTNRSIEDNVFCNSTNPFFRFADIIY